MGHNTEQLRDTSNRRPSDSSLHMEQVKSPEYLISRIQDHLGLRNSVFPLEDLSEEQLAANLQDQDWKVRVIATQILGSMSEKIPVNLLVKALEDEHEVVRIAALRAAGNLVEQVPIEYLVKALQDAVWTVRAAGANALGKLGARAPLKPLIEASQDEDESVRAAALKALGHLGSRVPKRLLLEALQDNEWCVREAAVIALGEQKDYNPLFSLLKKSVEKNDMVREAAKVVLRQSQESTFSEHPHKASLPIEVEDCERLSPRNHVSLSEHSLQKNQSKISKAMMFPNSKKRFGIYELRSLLGSGGFGEVYLGEHIHLHSLAAIKVLHDDVVNERAEQFRLEAQCVAQLAPHPHIMRILDFNIENGQPFIVMDYAINGDLRKRHGIGKKVPLADIVSYVKQLACGLQHAHDNGVVHCDVKPENMFVGSQSRIMIGDFGIAVVQQGNISQGKNNFGTTAYMSPEQITGQPEPASDQYALAIVVYEWLTGRLPFNGENKLAIAYQHLHTQPPSMCLRHPSIPAVVEKVVMKALSKDPLQRYASITAFAKALEEAAAGPRGQAAHTQRADLSVRRSEREPQHQQRGVFRRNSLFLPFSLIIVLLGMLLYAYVFLPAATVTITVRDMQQTWVQSLSAVIDSSDLTKNPVAVRTETMKTPPQKMTVATTGKQYIQATQAYGEVTFYNSDLNAYSIPSGTTIAVTVQNHSLQVVTDGDVTVPAGTLSQAGQITVQAHILQAGVVGNIAANTLYGATCCGSSAIRVNNQQAFSGGQDAQTYQTVQPSEFESAVNLLTTAQVQSAPAILQQHAHQGEILVRSSIQCTPTVNENAVVGSRATAVTVTVMSNCTGILYDSARLDALVNVQLSQQERQMLGNSYSIVGELRIIVTNAYVLQANDRSRTLLLDVVATGVWRHNFSKTLQQQILQAIAGKQVTTVREQLKNALSKEGLSMVNGEISWNLPGFNEDRLPTDVHQMNLIILHN